jgi:hypothetical protein
MSPGCRYTRILADRLAQLNAGLFVNNVRINDRYLTRMVGTRSCLEMHHGYSARYWISVQMLGAESEDSAVGTLIYIPFFFLAFLLPMYVLYVRMYACMYVYVCMHACMYVCMYVCLYICMYVLICMYACIYVCMYACMLASFLFLSIFLFLFSSVLTFSYPSFSLSRFFLSLFICLKSVKIYFWLNTVLRI